MLTLQGHRAALYSLAYSPDSRTLATGSADKSARLWDLATRQTTAILKGHRTFAHAVAFTPDGRLLASAGGDLFLRDPANGFAAVARQEGGRPVAGLAFSPDGRRLVTVGRRIGGGGSVVAGDVKFWDAASATALFEASANESRRKRSYAILPADAVMGEAALGEFLSRERLGAWSAAFDPSGALLAVGTDTGGVLLWDVLTAQLRERLSATAVVRSLAFSGDGRLLAAAEASRIRVWGVRAGERVVILKRHEKQVWSVAFSPRSTVDRATLLSGSQDGTVRIWDVNAGSERHVFAWPTEAVRCVAFAPDGMTAAAGGENGNVVVWDCDDD
jgi:WD40 repeat protein